MTKDETIEGLQDIIDRNKNTLLPRVHIGYLIHAIKYLKEQDEEIYKLQKEVNYLQMRGRSVK